MKETLVRIRDYLQFVAARVDDAGESILANIQDVMFKSKMDGIYVVRLKDGTRYYTNEPPTITGDNQKVYLKRLTQWADPIDQRVPVNPSMGFDLLKVDVQRRNEGYEWESPEWLLLKEMKEALLTINDQNWERVLLQLLERVHAEQRQDPIFRYVYLDSILRTLAKGCPTIQEKNRIAIRRMGDLQLGVINPFDPMDTATAMRRRDAAEILLQFPDPKLIAADVVKAREAAGKLSIGGQYRWVGWLHRDTSGWTCAASRSVSLLPEGDLMVYTKGQSEVPQFQKIGTTRNNPAVTETAAFLTEGMPVYLYEP